MSEEIIKVLDAICAKLGIVIDWTAANALPYMQELIDRYISFEIASSIYYIILWSGIVISLYAITRYAWPKAGKVYFDVDHLISWIAVIGLVATLILSIVAICVIGTQAMDIITCLTLPEKKIFEFLANVTRGVQ